MTDFKLLNMIIEIDRYRNSSDQKPKFKNVTFDEVLQSIANIESSMETV